MILNVFFHCGPWHIHCRHFPCEVNRSSISFFKAKLTKMVEFYGVFTYISAAWAIFCAALTIACGLLPRLSIFAIYGPALYHGGWWKHTWEMKKEGKWLFFHNKALLLVRYVDQVGIFLIYRKSSIRSRPCVILDPKFSRLVLE